MSNKPDHSPFSPEQLARGFAENDANVLEHIYLQNFPAVQRYILKNNGSESDAKDIYQEAVITAWMNAKEGKYTATNGATPGGYIFQIAKHKWLDKLKSKQYRSTVRLEQENMNNAAPAEALEKESHSLNVAYLTKLYNQLDEKCQMVLNKFYFEKKSLTEIAEDLGNDPGSIRTIKYRCMMKLRKMHQTSQNTEKQRHEQS